MDHFKDANDTYGHMFGDEVLKHLSGKLRDSVRDSDIVARIGGDEFMICMECEIDPEPLVKRIFNTITGEYEASPVGQHRGCVRAGRRCQLRRHIQGRRRGLYDMKRGGRGGYVFVDPDAQPGEDFQSTVSSIDE